MILLISVLFHVQNALAWEKHAVLMTRLLETPSAAQHLAQYPKLSFPCNEEEKAEILNLSKELEIDGTKIPLFSTDRCNKGQKTGEISIKEMFGSSIIDEPDQGMDQNLPASVDPKGDRKWMGGETGPTSQGFRHMIFPGIAWMSPLQTFQIPLGSIGQALDRISKMRELAARYLKSGNIFWALRITLWELHYLQDLHQPFHVTQAPSLKLVPWNKLFSHFVAESTHSISNYHYAYEGLVLEMMNEPEVSQLQGCFEPTPGAAFENPFELVEVSRKFAPSVGRSIYAVFGDSLKSKEVDLPNGVGQIDYFALLHASAPNNPSDEEKKLLSSEELKVARTELATTAGLSELRLVTCELMKSVSRYTWAELDRLFAGSQSISNKSGK